MARQPGQLIFVAGGPLYSFLELETLELIMEAEFERLRFFNQLGFLVSSGKTANPICFGKGD